MFPVIIEWTHPTSISSLSSLNWSFLFKWNKQYKGFFFCWIMALKGFPHSSVTKESACSAGDLGSILGWKDPLEKGKGYPLQFSGLENSMDCPWGRKESNTTERLLLYYVMALKKKYYWLLWVFFTVCGLFSSCREWGLLSSGGGFSCCGAWALGYTGSAVVVHGHVGSSQIGDQTNVLCIARWLLNHWTTREVPTKDF